MNADPLALDPWSHTPVVRRALRRLGVPQEALDDAVQDVFTVLVRREADFDRTRSLTNWLWGVARGVAATHRRSGSRRARLLEALASAPIEAPDLDDVIARAAATARVTEFVERLPATLREVFVLAHVHGHSGPEIAAGLGINLNTAYARIRAARIRFEAEFAPRETTSLGTRLMRAFAPVFAASSKSFATASLSASLVWVGATLPVATVPVTAATVSVAVQVAPVELTEAPSRPARTRTTSPVAKQPVMLDATIATAALGVARVATPTVGLAAPPKAASTRFVAGDQGTDESARRSDAGGVTFYDFVEGDRAHGVVQRPEGAHIDAHTRVKFPSLISVRPHFMPELVRLAKDL